MVPTSTACRAPRPPLGRATPTLRRCLTLAYHAVHARAVKGLPSFPPAVSSDGDALAAGALLVFKSLDLKFEAPGGKEAAAPEWVDSGTVSSRMLGLRMDSGCAETVSLLASLTGCDYYEGVAVRRRSFPAPGRLVPCRMRPCGS